MPITKPGKTRTEYGDTPGGISDKVQDAYEGAASWASGLLKPQQPVGAAAKEDEAKSKAFDERRKKKEESDAAFEKRSDEEDKASRY